MDIDGHYRALGVPPTASPEEIKRAFRTLARDLHPDSNPGKDTTAAFQRISQAYDTLKDPERRASYDAEGARRMREEEARRQAYSSGAKPRSTGSGAKAGEAPLRAEVRLCARCGRLSAQPRAVFFMAVRGLLTVTRVRRKGGIYCPRCAMRIGLGENLLNWVFGWWSLPFGPLRVLEASITNMIGGEKPAADNVNLLYQQALGFHFAGHEKIARGIIEDALKLAPNLRMRDQLLALKRQLGGEGKSRVYLNNEWWLFDKPIFYAQAVPLGLLIAMIVSTMMSMVNIQIFDWRALGRDIENSVGAMLHIAPKDTPGIAGEAPEGQLQEVTGDGVVLYAAPSTNARKLGTLRKGIRVVVITNGAVGGWAAIVLPDQRVGYAAASGLQPVAVEPAVTPDGADLLSPPTDRATR